MIQETKNNNKKVIILLTIIIVILSVLCVLFATKIIDLKPAKSGGNTVNNLKEKVSEEEDDDSELVTRYYQYCETVADNYKCREIELNVDGTARWSFGGSASGGESYKGTYTEDTSKIVLTLDKDMVDGTVCDDNTSQFPCKTTVTLNKNSDKTVTSHYELSNDGSSFIYKLVEKTELNLLK